MSSALSVRNLHTSVATGAGLVPVLEGVDLTLRKGETLGVVAPSGGGKSILAKSVMKLIRPPGRILQGEVLLGERDVLTMPEAELRRVRGEVMSLIVPDARDHLNPLLPVGAQIANVYLAHNEASRREALELAIGMMEAVGIQAPAERAQAYPHELSGGMAQRVIICMALINSPEVLIADEPTFGLDVTIQRQVLELFHQLVSDLNSATIILTRDMGIVAQYCQRVAVLSQGQISEQMEVDAFFARRQQLSSSASDLDGPATRATEPQQRNGVELPADQPRLA